MLFKIYWGILLWEFPNKLQLIREKLKQQHENNIHPMIIDKQQKKLAQIDQLIRTEATGAPETFAHKLNIAKTTLYEYLNYMKELGAEIIFDRHRNCFKYKRPCKLQFLKIEIIEDENLDEIKGGKNNLKKFPQFGFFELTNYIFAP